MPRLRRLGAIATTLAISGCEIAYPEVVVVNSLGARVLMRNPKFNGCAWEVVLAYGESTSPGRCLPGEDQVHFQKLDLDEEATVATPVWYNYETISVKDVGYRSFHTFEVQADDIEQDFSVPGPFGH